MGKVAKGIRGVISFAGGSTSLFFQNETKVYMVLSTTGHQAQSLEPRCGAQMRSAQIWWAGGLYLGIVGRRGCAQVCVTRWDVCGQHQISEAPWPHTATPETAHQYLPLISPA